MRIGSVCALKPATGWALAACTAFELLLGACRGSAEPRPRFSGYEIVRARETVSGRTGHSVKISCPPGKQPVGGGWAGANPTLMLNTSEFMPPPSARRARLGNRWHVWVGNHVYAPQEIEAAAVCVRVEASGSQ